MYRPLWAITAWGLSVGLLPAADKPRPGADPQTAVEAIRRVDQLGDPSFEARRTAADRLAALGLGARDALIGGLKHSDPHVRRQCRWILGDVLAMDYRQRLAAFIADTADSQSHDMPCWLKFKRLVGGDSEARKLFIDMLQAEGPLLETAAAGNVSSEAIASALILRCQNATVRLSQVADPSGGEAGRQQLPVGTVAAILFILADPELKLPLVARENYFAMNWVQQPEFRATMADGRQTALKKLLGLWLVSPGSLNMLMQRMQIAFQLHMPEALDLGARFMSEAKLGNPMFRMQGIVVVGRMGGKSHVALLAPLLADTTEVTRTGSNPQHLRVCQIRDVALAWLIHLTGEDFDEYGMPEAKLYFPQATRRLHLLFDCRNLGYEDPKARDAALARWKRRVAEKPLDRLPERPMARIELIDVQAAMAAAGPKPPVAGDAPAGPRGMRPRQADHGQTQALGLARNLCRQECYTEGVRMLDDILAAGEDSLFEAKGPVPVWRSLKGEAERILAELPAQGRAEYRLQFDAISRKMLDEAVRSGRPDAIAAVAARFFYTAAGAEAAWLEGLYWRDRGEPFRAALCLARLRNSSPDADRLEPLLSIELAGCSMRAGMARQARTCLARLTERRPRAAVLVAGNAEPLPADSDEAAARIRSLLGRSGQAEADGWLMYQGDSARNASGALGTPLVDSREAITAVSTGPLCEKLEALRKQRLEQRRLTIPDLYPLVVGKTAVIRSATRLAAFDLAASTEKGDSPHLPERPATNVPSVPGSAQMGTVPFFRSRLLWETPAEDSLASYLRDKAADAGLLESAAVSRGLKRRFWEDPNFGMPTSDGQRVFLLENLFFGFGPEYQRIGVGPDGRRRIEGESIERHNLLCGYDLATGKLLWEIGGAAGQDALPLAGTLFLGPPLPLAGRLYVLAEMDRQTRLLELDARTGGLLAVISPELTDPEPSTNQPFFIFGGFGGVAGPQGRPRPSASPSCADGILVFQATENQYAGLDLAGRNLRWIYQVADQERATPAAMVMNAFLLRQRAAAQDVDDDRWLDAPPTIAEGRVLLTPRDSNDLVCLSLADGQPQWSSPRLDGLYVGGVQQGIALVVGRGHVWALRMTDGQPAWEDRSIPLPEGQLPGGHGLLGRGRYYLPLSSGEIAAFDLAGGKLVARSRGTPQRLPGNLVACGDGVLAQNVDGVWRFDTIQFHERQLADRAGRHAEDAAWHRRRGELALCDGRMGEAVEQLRRSLELKADSEARQLLADAFCEGLRTDPEQFLPQAIRFEADLRSDPGRAGLLRALGLALAQAGQRVEALKTYLKLLDAQTGPDEMERFETACTVSRSRWTAARIAEVLSAGDSERPALEGLVADRLAGGRLREFIAAFASHPLAQEARLRLAGKAQREPGARVQLVVVLRDVVRHYGRFAALRGVSAEFQPAKLYLILGENGAGKSTLLRIVAGLLRPTRGSVALFCTPTEATNPSLADPGNHEPRSMAARIGYIGHEPLLYDELSAMENLHYFAGLYGISDQARCAGAIRAVGLDPALTRRVGQYSQGMRQRISLARAIVHDPELLLLDEPFSNVDVQSAQEMARLLGRMRDAGKTILVVTHQPVLLETLADESLLLAGGLLAAREAGLPEHFKSPYGLTVLAPLSRQARPSPLPGSPVGGAEGSQP